MAERRMFSKRIISSARFLRMPASAQSLYFHLGMAADDDGIVEAYPVMQMINAAEDDLKILAAKGFVRILNEDLVTYILDWKENNKVRADRKVDSIYKDLLLQVLPDEKLIRQRERADRPQRADKPRKINDSEKVNEGTGTTMGRPGDNHGTSRGQPMDNHGTTMGRHRLGKDRLGKDRLYAAAANARDPTSEEKDLGEVVKAFCDNLQPFAGNMVLEQLNDAFDTYGKNWCMEAIREASASGGRSIQYVIRILQRWERDGFKAERKETGKNGGADRNGGSSGENSGEKSVYAEYFDRCTGTPSEETGGSPGAGDGDPALLREENGEAAHRRRAPDDSGGVSGTA